MHCAGEIGRYADDLVAPAGQSDRNIVAAGKANIDRTVATLGLKEMSQSTLIRKLCALPRHHPTRKAVFEFDRLIRSLYTLEYLRDPQLQRDVHRSRNRIEVCHPLRAALAQVGGKKQRIGDTDLDVAITSRCGRLTANVIIACNTILLSALLERYRAAGGHRALRTLRNLSPVAWQHLHFLGRFCSAALAPHRPRGASRRCHPVA